MKFVYSLFLMLICVSVAPEVCASASSSSSPDYNELSLLSQINCASPTNQRSVCRIASVGVKQNIDTLIGSFNKRMDDVVQAIFAERAAISKKIVATNPFISRDQLKGQVCDAMKIRIDWEKEEFFANQKLIEKGNQDAVSTMPCFDLTTFKNKILNLLIEAKRQYTRDRAAKYLERYEEIKVVSGWCGLTSSKFTVCRNDQALWRDYYGHSSILNDGVWFRDCDKCCIGKAINKDSEIDWQNYKEEHCGIQ